MRKIRLSLIFAAAVIVSAIGLQAVIHGLEPRVAHATVDANGNLVVSPAGTYSASPPSPSSGGSVGFQTDAHGNLLVSLGTLLWYEDAVNKTAATSNKVNVSSTYTPSVDTALGTAVTHNSKASAGVLYTAWISNANAATRYLQFYNSTGATTGTPFLSFPVTASTVTPVKIDLGTNGVYMSTGITWAFSTTQATYTAGAASDCNIDLLYY